MIGFRQISTRLLVRYGVLLATAMAAVTLTSQLLIRRHVETTAQNELVSSVAVYSKIWEQRARALSAHASVLGHDFGSRSAIASGDAETIRSALDNLAGRVNMPQAYFVSTEGHVLGNSRQQIDPRLAKMVVWAAEQQSEQIDQFEQIDVIGGRPFRLIASPVMAPVLLGYIVFAVPIDAAELDQIRRLAPIALQATLLHRAPDGRWTADRGPESDEQLARLVALSGAARDRVRTVTGPDGPELAIVEPLNGNLREAKAALLLTYPWSAALVGYRELQLGVTLSSIFALLLALLGGVRLSSAITQPIVELERAAHNLESGMASSIEVTAPDEIGRLAESLNRIGRLAFHDNLTGLANRTFVNEQLQAALEASIRLETQTAMLCLDLDRFKLVNDKLGHQVGDALLKRVGKILRDSVSDGTVARLGGDEFAIVLPNCTPERARLLGQALIDTLAVPMKINDYQVATGTSVGVAFGPKDAHDAAALMRAADLALYSAKRSGRGVVRFFEPGLDSVAQQRHQIETELRDALQSGQFLLAFQPVLNIEKGEVRTQEALLRWQHPTKGNIAPDEFIPIAESNGLIVAMGEWVLREACREAAAWPGNFGVAVNVSPLQFRNSGFLNAIFQALSQSGLSPDRLEIELTESIFLDGEAAILAQLHRLREAGVRIALDDFGTGYSSLSYLRSFPFDRVKIDKVFIHSLQDDESTRAVVRSIIDLAHALHMDVTAEGVETAEQLDLLKSFGCDNIQGFLIGIPQSVGNTSVVANAEFTPLQVGSVVAGTPTLLTQPPRLADRQGLGSRTASKL